MIIVGGTVRATAQALEALRPEMLKVLEANRKEDGCISFDFAVSVSDPGTLVVFERWRDAAALAAHSKSAHVAAWREAVGKAGAMDRQLMRWETDEGVKL